MRKFLFPFTVLGFSSLYHKKQFNTYSEGNFPPEKSKFLTFDIASKIREKYLTPVFVYDESSLRNQALKALNFPNSYGLTVRFAMKSCPNAAILRLFNKLGLKFDASSGFEVERAIIANIPITSISLSSQELPRNFEELIKLGLEFNACSLHQLEEFGKLFPGRKCGIRFNPGLGSGGTGKTNVGGPASSFGIWHEKIDDVKKIVSKYDLQITRIHTHIGSGSDPAVWQRVSLLSLDIVRQFPQVEILNLGGGFKVGRMSHEPSTDLQVVGSPIQKVFETFAQETGRRLHLEIEPGTFLVANAGSLLCSVQDEAETGKEGYRFLKLDCGMTEILRPSLYGAQHPIVVLPSPLRPSSPPQPYVFVGHCCESGDLFSCSPGNPESLSPRLTLPARIGDLVSIEGAGAYCSGMSTKNYNSFPEAPEVWLDTSGDTHLIRRSDEL